MARYGGARAVATGAGAAQRPTGAARDVAAHRRGATTAASQNCAN